MKNRSDIKIIFVDIDWTLYDHKHKCFNKSGIKALNKAHKNGVKVVLCTGRPYCSMKGVGVFDVLDVDGYICTNGGLAYCDGQHVLKNTISPDVVERIIKLADKHHLVLEIMTPSDAYLVNEESDIVKRFFEFWVEVKPRYDVYRGEEVTSMLLFATNEVDKEFKKLPVFYYRFFDEGCDIYPYEYHKGLGAKAVLKHYGFLPKEAMAIGDDRPDIEMFNEVKYSVAMGNGRDEAKENALYVTKPIDKKGLKKALKKVKVI